MDEIFRFTWISQILSTGLKTNWSILLFVTWTRYWFDITNVINHSFYQHSINCLCYKALFTSSLTLQQNKLERFVSRYLNIPMIHFFQIACAWSVCHSHRQNNKYIVGAWVQKLGEYILEQDRWHCQPRINLFWDKSSYFSWAPLLVF